MHARIHSARSATAVAIAVLLHAVATLDADGAPRGVEPGAELILDAIRNSSGGEKVGSAYMGKLTLALDLDSADAGLWDGTHARFNVLATFGDSLSELAGDVQVASNIEAPDDVRVFEAWIEQALGSRASILAGYNDFNAEFDVTTMAAGLLNSSFGVGPEVSQVGPSIFPRSYPGLRLRVNGNGGGYFLAGGWSGVPFPITDPVSGKELDGTFGAVELGWTREAWGRLGSPKLSTGVWRFEAAGGDIPQHGDSLDGFYALAEAEIALRGGRKLGGFVRAGRARDDLNPIREYIGWGVRLAPVFGSRLEDELSFGVAHARLAPELRDELALSAETTVEVNWKFQLNGFVALVPDIQYVAAPAGTAGARDALLVGLRAVITWPPGS